MSDLFYNSRQILQAQIESCLENGIEQRDFVKVVLCLNAANISEDTISELIKATIDGVLNPSEAAQCLTQSISDRLDIKDFQRNITGKPDANILLESFSEAERVWFYLVDQIFIFYNHNVAETNKYRKFLQSKKTQSIKKTKWGDVDETGWAKVLSEFASEKLFGSTLQIAFDALPIELRSHLEKVNAYNLVGRFAWIVFETGAQCEYQNNAETNSSSKKGIEFEHALRYRIEAEIPSAIVEMTPGSGDQGADLIVCIKNLKLVIQAKNYTGNVGNSAVQEVYAAKGYYDADIAVVVTNSEFTQSARSLAAELEVLLVYETQVIDLLKTADR